MNIGYCGNTLSAGSVAQPTNNDCSFVCTGNPYEYCGAGSRLEMYRNGAAPTAPSVSSGGSSTSSSAATLPTVNPGTPIQGFTYQGCFIDGVNGRILSNQQPDNQALTQESCVAACAAAGYSIAGMEYSVQCFCDNVVYNGGALAPVQADCNDPCSGNKNEMCGGGGRMSLYSTGTPKVYLPPSVQKTGLPTSWTYSGCLQ